MSPCRPAPASAAGGSRPSARSMPAMPTCWKPSSRPQSLIELGERVRSRSWQAMVRPRCGKVRAGRRSITPACNPLSAGIYTAAQVRALDRRAIERCGVPGYELMTRAGHATLECVAAQRGRMRARVIVLLRAGQQRRRRLRPRAHRPGAGPARHVVARRPVPTRRRRAARLRRFRRGRRQLRALAAPRAGRSPTSSSMRCSASGSREPSMAAAAEVIGRDQHDRGRPVVAVDIPSGLHADTGARARRRGRAPTSR